MISLRGLCLPGGNFVFVLDSVSGNAQSQVNVPVRAIHFDGVISIQGTIGFDTADLSFAGVTAFGLPSMSNANFGVSLIPNGMLTFSWNEANLLPITVQDSTVLFEVVFQILGAPGSHTPVEFLNGPTVLEVVDAGYNVIPHSIRNGEVTVKVPPTCPEPDSLAVSGISQTQATLSWYSANAGASYVLEWGPLGFAPGNGTGQFTGTCVQGINTLQLSGLQPDSSYAFYVQEQCGSLPSLNVGPMEFVTQSPPALVPVILFADSVTAYQGDTVTVNFRVRDFVSIISMQFSLGWDTAVAQYASIGSMQLPAMGVSNFNLSQAANGSISVSWNDPTLVGVTLPDSAPVFSIRYAAVGAGAVATPVAYGNSPVQIEVVDNGFVPLPTNTVNGRIALLDTGVTVAVRAGMNVNTNMVVYPNPIGQGDATIHVKTGMEATAIHGFDVVNLFGQSLPQAVQGWTAGEGALTIHLWDELPAGQYDLRITAESGISHLRIMNLGK